MIVVVVVIIVIVIVITIIITNIINNITNIITRRPWGRWAWSSRGWSPWATTCKSSSGAWHSERTALTVHLLSLSLSSSSSSSSPSSSPPIIIAIIVIIITIIINMISITTTTIMSNPLLSSSGRYLGQGNIPCFRGSLVYDTELVREVWARYLRHFKAHRRLLAADVIHVRRPNGRSVMMIIISSSSITSSSPPSSSSSPILLLLKRLPCAVLTEMPSSLSYIPLCPILLLLLLPPQGPGAEPARGP
jgi:hypothetical protein